MMVISDLLKKIEPYCGEVQESDLEDLVFTLRLDDDYMLEVVFDSDCQGQFKTASDVVVDYGIETIVNVRWIAAGACASGSLT